MVGIFDHIHLSVFGKVFLREMPLAALKKCCVVCVRVPPYHLYRRVPCPRDLMTPRSLPSCPHITSNHDHTNCVLLDVSFLSSFPRWRPCNASVALDDWVPGFGRVVNLIGRKQPLQATILWQFSLKVSCCKQTTAFLHQSSFENVSSIIVCS